MWDFNLRITEHKWIFCCHRLYLLGYIIFLSLFLKHIHFQHRSICMYHKWYLTYTCITIYNYINIAIQHKIMMSMYLYFTIVSSTQYVRNNFELTKKGKFCHYERKSKRITKTEKEKKMCRKHAGNFQASVSSLYK